MSVLDHINGLTLAQLFHNAYEGLAPQFGYTTREESREFDADSQNGQLMIATAEAILVTLRLYELKRITSLLPKNSNMEKP